MYVININTQMSNWQIMKRYSEILKLQEYVRIYSYSAKEKVHQRQRSY